MLTSKVSTDILLVVYIAFLSTIKSGRCQLSGRSFDSSRYRQHAQVENRSYPRWNGGSNARSTDTINNRHVPSSRGNLNNRNMFETPRRHVPYDTFNDNPRALSEQYTQPYVSFTGSDSFFRPSLPTLNNRELRMNTDSDSFANMQTARFRESPHRRVTTHGSSRNNIAREFPYRRRAVSRGRLNLRDGSVDLYQGRFRNNNRPRFENSQTERVLHRQPYHTSTETQLSGQPRISSIHSAMLPRRESSNQSLASRFRVRQRPRFRAERNEVFQYRTSVMRTPQSSDSSYRNNNDQGRFSGYPTQSLSLPFEPLSLRYRGFRESKLAAQRRLQSDRIRNDQVGNTGQNTESRQSGPQFGQRQANLATDTENTNKNITFQPRIAIFSTRNTPSFRNNRVEGANSRNIGFVYGRHTAGHNTNVHDRNIATRNNRLIGSNRGPIFQRAIDTNNRIFGRNSFNRYNLPHTRVLDRLGQTRRSFNRNRLSANEEWWNRRGNNIDQTNLQNGALHELFGISRTGLENALKSDAQQADRTINTRNDRPDKSSVSRANSYNRQLQHADNNNNQNKENLIAEITKSLEIADQLGLMGLHQRNSQSHTRFAPRRNINNESVEKFIKLPDGFISLPNQIRQQNTDQDDDEYLYNRDDDFNDK